MGGMQTWIWGVTYPDFMDALVPMASQPTEMSSRNWMMRRLIIDAIRNDPDWKDGNYTTQPRALQVANVFFGIATNGGTLAYQKLAPTRELADKLLDQRLAAPFTRRCQRLPVSVGFVARLQPLAGPGAHHRRRCWRSIPPTTSAIRRRPGIMERELKRVKNGRALPDPGERGHARPRHHRHGEVLEAAGAGAAADRAPAGDVNLLT